MAKAKKSSKAKARKTGKKAKAKKSSTKKAAVKKSSKKKLVKKKPAAKKVAKKKKTIKKIKLSKVKSVSGGKKSIKKTAVKIETKKISAKEKAIAKKKEKIEKKLLLKEKHAAHEIHVPIEKPEKERKKTKEELAEEKEALGLDEGYSWENNLADMKNYEPTPVFRKPEPPQPKFKGKKDNRTRYSDKELKEFREIINEKIAEAEKDYELLKNTLAHRDEQGTDDTSPTFKVLEDGSDAMSREEIAQLASRQEKYIQNLKNALIRIENKTYGICRVTGKLIPKERLKSVPHATLSIEAKLMQNS